jgi:hypothetical protein
MTENHDTATTEVKKISKKKLLAAGLLVAVLGAGALLARTGMDEELAKKRLDEIIAGIKAEGQKEGRDIDLSYEKIEMSGSLLNRHAMVRRPVLTIRPYDPKLVTPDPKDTLRITTEEMAIHGASYDLSALKLSLPKPLDFAGGDTPEKSLLKVEANSPIEATIAQEKVKGVPYIAVSHVPPTTLDLTYLREMQAHGTEDATPQLTEVRDAIHVTIAPGSKLSTKMAQDGSGLGAADVSFKQITTAPKSAPEGVITVAGIEGKWRNEVDATQANRMSHQWKVGPITSAANALPYAPIALDVDFLYQGAAETAQEGAAEKKPTTQLKQFLLSTKDATLSANADFVINQNDILPTGKANLKLTNVPFVYGELEKRGLLKPENKTWVADLLQQITGTPFEQLKDADILIERPEGGQFKIGNSTFEEVFALFMKRALNIENPEAEEGVEEEVPHVPQLPDATHEKAKPIEVPDHGVRG